MCARLVGVWAEESWRFPQPGDLSKKDFIMCERNESTGEQEPNQEQGRADIVASAPCLPLSTFEAAFLKVQPGDFFATVGRSMFLMRLQPDGAAVCIGEVSGDNALE